MTYELKNKDNRTYLTILDIDKAIKASENQLQHHENDQRWESRFGNIFRERIDKYKQLKNGNSLSESSK